MKIAPYKTSVFQFFLKNFYVLFAIMKLTYSPVGQVIYCSLIKYIYLPTYLPTYLHIQNKYQDCIPSNALGGVIQH